MKDKKLKKVELEADNLMEESEEMTFDVYFQVLLKERKVLAHHKPPMRQHAEANGMSSATRTEFDELFKSY
jgi:hypothetical protein